MLEEVWSYWTDQGQNLQLRPMMSARRNSTATPPTLPPTATPMREELDPVEVVGPGDERGVACVQVCVCR